MSNSIPRRRQRSRAANIDLYDYARMLEPRPRGRSEPDLDDWRVADDWPARVPVTPAELDVFEAWFGDLFDDLFGPLGVDRSLTRLSSQDNLK
jgi:hypothetical protein